jgi:hypothetical protein
MMGHPTSPDGSTHGTRGYFGGDRPSPGAEPDGLPIDDGATGTTIRHEAPLSEFDIDEDETIEERELDVRSGDITLFT